MAELLGMKYTSVSKMTIAAGQPSVLELRQDCHLEHRSLRSCDHVTYTDPDMGAHFDGYVIEPKETGTSNDESVTMTAADLGRTMQKEPALLICKSSCPSFFTDGVMGTSKFHIVKGTTVREACTLVCGVLGPDGLDLMGALNIETALGNEELVEDLDKGGMSVAEWMDAIVDQTVGGVWFTRGDDIFVLDYTAQAPVALEEGAFGAKDPTLLARVGKLLVVRKDIGESTNGKFRAVRAEGKGIFRRVTVNEWNEGNPSCEPDILLDSGYEYKLGMVREAGDNDMTGTGKYDGGATNNWSFNFRVYLPHSVVTDAYFDTQLKCAKSVKATWDVEYTDGQVPPVHHHDTTHKEVTMTLYTDNDPFDYTVGPGAGKVLRGSWTAFKNYAIGDVVTHLGAWYEAVATGFNHVPPDPAYWSAYVSTPNPRLGWFYVGIPIDIAADPGDRPGAPFFNAVSVRYTGYEGPFAALVEGSARLGRDGVFPVQRPDLFKYSQEEILDPFTSGDPPTHVILEPAFVNDDTAELQQAAQVLAERYTGDPHIVGTIVVCIPKGGNPLKAVTIGSALPLYGPKVRVNQINFLYAEGERNAELSVTTIPLRDRLKKAKDDKVLVEEQRKNWRSREPVECLAACLPDIVLNNSCRPVDATTACTQMGSGVRF